MRCAKHAALLLGTVRTASYFYGRGRTLKLRIVRPEAPASRHAQLALFPPRSAHSRLSRAADASFLASLIFAECRRMYSFAAAMLPCHIFAAEYFRHELRHVAAHVTSFSPVGRRDFAPKTLIFSIRQSYKHADCRRSIYAPAIRHYSATMVHAISVFFHTHVPPRQYRRSTATHG